MSLVPLTTYVSMSGLQNGDSVLCEASAECVDRDPLVDLYGGRRRLIKGAQIGVSLLANGSYFPIILRAGAAYAVGNGVSFFALDYWAVTGTLEEALGARGEREIVLMQRNSKGNCYKISLITGALGLALLAVAPIALPTLDYDGAYGVPGMISVFLGGSILPLRSIQLSLNKSIQGMTCVLGDVGKKVEAIRGELCEVVDAYRGVFEQLGMSEKLQMIAAHRGIRELDERDKVGRYLTVVLGGVKEVAEEKSKCDKFVTVLGNLPGVFLASSLETVLAVYTYSKAQEYITDSELGAGVFTAVTIGAGVYLNGKSIVNTTHRFACAFFNGLRCKREKGISEQLRPKLTACLKLLGLTLNLGTVGSTLVIYGDFFKDNEKAKDFSEVTLSMAYFVLTATATLDLVADVVKEIVMRKGEEVEKEVLLLCQDLSRFKRLLEKSSLLDFSVFILQCPEGIKNRILKKVALAESTLREYIRKLEPLAESRQLTA